MYISFFRAIGLHFIAILLLLLSLINVQSLLLAKLIPALELMIIYYFRIYKNCLFGIWFLFLMGLWFDTLNGLPLGLSSFCYLVGTKFFNTLNQRVIKVESFAQVWRQFVGFIFFIFLLRWLLLSAYNLSFYDFTGILIQLITSGIFYPIMHKFFDYLVLEVLNEKYSV